MAAFPEEVKERTGRLGHVHGMGSFLVVGTRKGPQGHEWIDVTHRRTVPGRQHVGKRGQAAATGGLIARTAAQVKLTFMPSL